MQRYTVAGEYDTLIECDDGPYMEVADHEAALDDARRQEREKCVEELEKHSAGLKPSAQQMYVDVALHYASHYLKKGLK